MNIFIKKYWLWICIIGTTFIMIPIVIGLIINLNIDSNWIQKYIVGKNNDWLSFLATYIGAFATAAMAIATFITLKNNKEQIQKLEKQNFENTLFNLLDELKATLKIVRYRNNNPIYGAEALKELWEYFCEDLHIESYFDGKDNDVRCIKKGLRTNENINNKEIVSSIFLTKIWNLTSDFNTYFQTLLTVVKYVDESTFDYTTKAKYMKYITSRLLENSLKWLFYFCVFDTNLGELKVLVEKWGLLSNLRREKLVNSEHAEWLSSKAFKTDY